jgi:hypothetical protein
VTAANEVFGWSWTLAGMLAGMGLGFGFHREGWLGGYASHPRRLLRLGHLSFIGLGIVNILFARTAAGLELPSPWPAVASGALIVGGVAMPLCCALMAWRRALQPLFAIPVVSLLLGVGIVVAGMVSR